MRNGYNGLTVICISTALYRQKGHKLLAEPSSAELCCSARRDSYVPERNNILMGVGYFLPRTGMAAVVWVVRGGLVVW